MLLSRLLSPPCPEKPRWNQPAFHDAAGQCAGLRIGRLARGSWTLLSPIVCLLSLTVLGTATIVQAQERTGSITGELKDASGGVLPDATVVITNEATGRVTTIVTDGAGMNYLQALERWGLHQSVLTKP